MRQYLNWKIYLAITALFIVSASLYYTAVKLDGHSIKRAVMWHQFCKS